MHMPSLPRFGYFISRHQQPIETAQSTTQLDVHGRGLQGAQYIISTLKQRSTIQYLVLGNNSFGDDGVTTLFQFLSSDRGRRLKIVEISLNSCDIGNLGLRAVCGYLNGNMTLTSLFLQNNEFNPSWALCSTFTSAINSSRLKVLSLTSNPHLGDTFLFRFLPNICTPYLQELHLSAMGLTTISTPHVVAFLSTDLPASSSSSLSSSTSSSPPTTEEKPQLLSLLEVDKPQPTTRLRDLRLNGNSLTLPCAEKIVQALEHANFSVRHLEMYANRFNVGFWDPPPLQQLQLPVPPLLAPIHSSA
ncbi:hypothetical protein FRB97_006382 [Tulasnella sp. 331]|nr:hypothetical protein FRB97_006382 [Tulasnella sp. 331]